jgi:hypothetical protein
MGGGEIGFGDCSSELWEYVPKLQGNQKWVEENSSLVTEVVFA